MFELFVFGNNGFLELITVGVLGVWFILFELTFDVGISVFDWIICSSFCAKIKF